MALSGDGLRVKMQILYLKEIFISPLAGQSKDRQGSTGMAVVGPLALSPQGDAQTAVFNRKRNISSSWKCSALPVGLGSQLILTTYTGSPQGHTMRPPQTMFVTMLPMILGEQRLNTLIN